MKKIILLLTLSIVIVAQGHAIEQDGAIETAKAKSLSTLIAKQWIHGSEDCASNTDPAIEVFQYDNSSFILRQSKCLSYEAPFIYVLFGDEKTLVLDTGATEEAASFPLYQTIIELQQKHLGKVKTDNREILVIHSHSHSDHRAADSQFIGKKNVTVVAANNAGIHDYFSFENWPKQQVELDLGGRSIIIIPTPGHQEEAITLYDEQTKWLLTGDTFYPGFVYVKDWDDYKNSIARLASFTDNYNVSAILGAHIEKKNQQGEYYEVGSTYQPQESSLVLKPSDLAVLNERLKETDKAEKISLNGLVIEPLGFLPKLISNIVGWFM